MKSITLSTVTMTAAFSGCAPQNSFQSQELRAPASSQNSKIVGGEKATAEYQKQHGVVQIKMIYGDSEGNTTGIGTCTGSLIAKNIVVTAAHCLYDPTITRIAVLFSLDDSTLTAEQVIGAQKGTIHPEYKPNTEDSKEIANDIALLKLSSDAPADFTLSALPTQETATELVKGAHLTLAGFGMTNAKVREIVKDSVTGQDTLVELPSEGSGELRLVNNIEVSDLNLDKEILMNQADPTQIKGACHGDSGGPAYLNVAGQDILVGVTSRGTEQLGNCTEGVIYTNVIGHLAWIKSESEALNKPELAADPVKPVPKKPKPRRSKKPLS